MGEQPSFLAYADGSCIRNPGPGGWGVVLISPNGSRAEFSGADPSTTNNRMEITAAVEALRRVPAGAAVKVCSDSQYVIKTMTRGWRRRENLELWKLLDSECAPRRVRWEWVPGHSGNRLNERADELAREAAQSGRRPSRPPSRAARTAVPDAGAPSLPAVNQGRISSVTSSSAAHPCQDPGAPLAHKRVEGIDGIEGGGGGSGQSAPETKLSAIGTSMVKRAVAHERERLGQEELPRPISDNPPPPSPPPAPNPSETTVDNETAIARSLRPLLREGETLRRCANCGRVFVATGDPPRMQAYCALAACQLKHRTEAPT